MNVIYLYCKGALFDYIKVQTLVVYATNRHFYMIGQKPAKNSMQKPAKNPMRTKICLDQPKTFVNILT